jgi:GNAT superfamily N-acetyltransferase
VLQESVSTSRIDYREASSADVPAMARCRDDDREVGPADGRMAAYLDGQHHPGQALAPRTAFVAIDGDSVVGYIAGHATTRHGFDGEVQYLYVAPRYRRNRVATTLLQSLARWFQEREIRRVCVNANIESPAAVPFYLALGAASLNKYWYFWDDIGVLLSRRGASEQGTTKRGRDDHE